VLYGGQLTTTSVGTINGPTIAARTSQWKRDVADTLVTLTRLQAIMGDAGRPALSSRRIGRVPSMPSPLGKAFKLARTPAGRKVLKEAVRIARSDEGRKLIAQARKVASSPEGKRLLEQARHLVKAPADAAHDVEKSKGWQALRDRFDGRKR
jgi:hypothetical protein